MTTDTMRNDAPAKKKAVPKTNAKSRTKEYIESIRPLCEMTLSKTGMKEGTVLDVGCGGAYLDVALADKTSVDFLLLDPSEKALEAAQKNMAMFGYEDRAKTILGDEQKIPLDDNLVDFAISTSGIGLWHNPQQGLEEMYRVTKPGGHVFITGIDWNAYRDYYGMLKSAGLKRFSVNNDGDDMWIDMFKPEKADEEDKK